MPLHIENTHDWPMERMAGIYPSILACIRLFVAEFPDEASEEHLLSEVMVGRRQLWVVFDEDEPDTALLAVLTECKQFDATGLAFVEIVGIGGERIQEALPLLDEIEQWAEKLGITMSVVIGRFGWIPLLKERGYEKKAVILKKFIGEQNDGH